MKRKILILILFVFCLSCEKDKEGNELKNSVYIARITGYDYNCSTCILEFPNDSAEIRTMFGNSPNNSYEAINLNKNDYQIGQLITVKLRKPEKNEVKACTTLYPASNLNEIYVTESENSEELFLNDTIEIFNRTCRFNSENQFFLCLDSVLEDSRCPTGALCIWEGDARIKFHFENLNKQPVYFVLHTNPKGTTGIIIDRYKIFLTDLIPFPSIYNREAQGPRRAKVIVKEIE
jgi:hypothetical protein